MWRFRHRACAPTRTSTSILSHAQRSLVALTTSSPSTSSCSGAAPTTTRAYSSSMHCMRSGVQLKSHGLVTGLNRNVRDAVRGHVNVSGVSNRGRHMSTGTSAATVAATSEMPLNSDRLNLPSGSTADVLMQRCIEQAGESGFVSEAYEPWMPVDLMQTLIITLVDNLEISWFTAIMTSSVLLRLVTLPLAVRAIRGSREKARARPEFDALFKLQQEAINDKTSKKASEKQEEVRNQMEAFKKKYGSPYLFPFKGTWQVMAIQVPLYITVFRSMKGFADHPHMFPNLALESPLWLESLALPDATYVLPSISVGLMLLNLQLYGSLDAGAEALNSKKHDNESLQKWAPYIVRGSVFLLLPVSGGMPSAVFVYMATNTVIVGLQNKLLKLPSVEAFLDFPKLSTKEDEEKLQAEAMQKPLYAWQDSLKQPRSKTRRKEAMPGQEKNGDGILASSESTLKQLSGVAPLFQATVPREKISSQRTLDDRLSTAIDSKYRITRPSS